VDCALTRRIEVLSARFLRLRLDSIAGLEENRRGVEIFDSARFVAGASLGSPDDPTLNRVVGLSGEDAEAIPPLVSWYRRKRIWPWFEVGPGDGAEALLDALAAEGAWPVGFLQVSTGPPGDIADEHDGRAGPAVVVEPVDGDAIGGFGTVLAAGHGADPAEHPDAVAEVARWHQVRGMVPLIGRIDGEMAGGAVLYAHDGAALLADSATVLGQRGRGVGTALLAERVRVAAALGCDVLAGTSRFGSPAHAAHQRAGLRGGYTRTVLHLGG